MNNPLTIEHNFSLCHYNSFGIEAKAGSYLRIESTEHVAAVFADSSPALAALPRLVLGGGSNVLFTGDFPGLVLHMCTKGIAIVGEDADAVHVRASAGESWHGLVRWTLDQGLGGLENLSLIPGTVGAAPIQNIGAYGAELQDCFHCLRAFDFESGEIFSLNKEECAFGYRDSVFKHALRTRALILDVTLALPKRWQANLGYAELAQALAQSGVRQPTAQDIGAAVTAIRLRKLPDPARIGNAGSFFKNPVVPAARRAALLGEYPALPSYPQADGGFKLAAGWLIEQCGWKGRHLGAAGVYPMQALVLINRGGASGAEIAALARAIIADVEARFGVRLEPEPVYV